MSKEEAIKILSEMRSEYNLFGDEEEATRYHVLSWAIKEMNAEPVRHGRWIKVEDDYNNCLYECSYCHTWTSLPTEEDSNGHIRYCWSCGAKMDGDSNTNSMR